MYGERFLQGPSIEQPAFGGSAGPAHLGCDFGRRQAVRCSEKIRSRITGVGPKARDIVHPDHSLPPVCPD
jgi:hypothetical protein